MTQYAPKPPIVVGKYGLTNSSQLPESVRAVYGKLIDAQVPKIEAILDEHEAASNALRTDGSLTPAGKRERAAELRDEAGKKLRAELANPRLEQDLKRTQQSVPQDLPEDNGPNAELRAIETRRRLLAKEPEDRSSSLKMLGRNGNVAAVHAALNDPLGEVVPAHQRDELRATALRAASPDRFAAAEVVEQAIRAYRGNVEMAARKIGAELDDKIADQAGPAK